MVTQNLQYNGTSLHKNTLLSQPVGLFCYGSAYTTGANLSSTPAAVEITLTESVDANSNWTVNEDATNGYVGYSGSTRYFSILATFDVATASGPGSTVSIKLQKKTGIVWNDLAGAEIDRYLSGTLDTGSLSLQSVTSIESGERLRLFISSDSDVPTYSFAHLQLKCDPFS